MTFYTKALITGASSGLGKALAELLAQKGIALLLCGRDAARLNEVAESLSSQVEVTTLCCDLNDRRARAEILSLIRKHLPDLIINNAGFGLYGEALSHTTKSQMEILEVNANALLEISLEAARTFIANQKRGTIVNISSAAAFFSFPTFAVYAAAKRFVVQFSKAFDFETAPQGVRVLVSCPGQIATHFRARAANHFPQKNSSHTMSVEKAAQHIWSQIEKQKQTLIFDWKYWIAVHISKLIPNWILNKLLARSLAERYETTKRT